MNHRIRDLLVHMFHEPKAQKVTVTLSRKGQVVGWAIFVAHDDIHGEQIMSFDCLQRGDIDALLAGWQWARSERVISRQTYKEGREWLASLFPQRTKGKRMNRHALTAASAKVISSVMGGKQ